LFFNKKELKTILDKKINSALNAYNTFSVSVLVSAQTNQNFSSFGFGSKVGFDRSLIVTNNFVVDIIVKKIHDIDSWT
jgi:hypothetical protein